MMKGSACGKVILLGEHAVVYGVPALVVGIDRGATATASFLEGEGRTSELTMARGAIRVAPGEGADLSRAFAALLEACAVRAPVHVEIETDLPAAAGLGCSAALGVAIVRALDATHSKKSPPGDVIARAMEWEKVFHGNPSGIDATAATRGGCLLYQREDGPAKIHEIALGRPLCLVVGHTGIASTTRSMVEHVAKLRQRKPDLVNQSFEAIRSLVANARLALEAGDTLGLGKLLDLNQMILSGLMLSTEETEALCRTARETGALGAKLTGSGGGGCVVALVDRDPERVLARWSKEGFRAFATSVEPVSAARAEERETP
jgi:mevalonate kinase